MFPKSVLTLLTVWLSASVCLAEDEPSFPKPTKRVEFVENQYIVQFENADYFEQSKLSTRSDGDEVQVVRHIDTRKIAVYKFTSKEAAGNWRKDAAGVKYFERGEKCGAFFSF